VRSGGTGDVLVFMPGGYEIQQTIEAIRQSDESKGFILLPLHGELPSADQDAAVARYERPKVVVSTNVAETSLTIDGIRLVIDSGLARLPRYDPNRGINTLLIEKISRAWAEQRTGRAGRTAPGHCLRLWSQPEHLERPMHELPEIKRLDLAEVVLTLKAVGVKDLRGFRWFEPPPEQSLRNAEVLLTDLGALDHRGDITATGRKMLAFPVHPRYSRMLLAAGEYGCVYQACLIAALTQGRDLLVRNSGKETAAFRDSLFGDRAASDFWILMRGWNYALKNNFRLEACRKAGIHMLTARQVGPLFDFFLDIARREGLDTQPAPVPDESIQKCILIGFSDRVARRLDEGTLRCDLVHGRRGVLARESAVQRHDLLVAAEVREVEGRDKSVNTLLSLATVIEADWLRELFPEDMQSEMRVAYDPAVKRILAEEQTRFRDLVLSARRVEPPPPDAAARILAEEVVQGRLALKNWDHGVEQWILRLNLLSQWCPELELAPIHDEDRRHLIEQICLGAVSYRDIKDREVKPVVRSWLSASQQQLLEKHAPERLALPNGRQPKVVYVSDGAPYIALRIQEWFGVETTPRIGMNRVPVLAHILAPNMRPVQITQDMASFWRDHYPQIKRELQRRYPKHEWR
ncbi:MAG: helicase, partial [Candidatus Omnitrophica bacterium]|nr:helicase [Candidatus Omnitrophota bacterium]